MLSSFSLIAGACDSLFSHFLPGLDSACQSSTASLLPFVFRVRPQGQAGKPPAGLSLGKSDQGPTVLGAGEMPYLHSDWAWLQALGDRFLLCSLRGGRGPPGLQVLADTCTPVYSASGCISCSAVYQKPSPALCRPRWNHPSERGAWPTACSLAWVS